MGKRNTVEELHRMQVSLGAVVSRLKQQQKSTRVVYNNFGAEAVTITVAELDVMISTLENEIALLRAMEMRVSRVKGMVGEISEALGEAL